MTGGGHVVNNRDVKKSVLYYKMPRDVLGEGAGRGVLGEGARCGARDCQYQFC
jgi:hypothetical protein